MVIHPKVTASGFAGAVAALLIAELGRRGVVIDGTEGAGIVFLLTALAGFFMPSEPDAG